MYIFRLYGADSLEFSVVGFGAWVYIFSLHCGWLPFSSAVAFLRVVAVFVSGCAIVLSSLQPQCGLLVLIRYLPHRVHHENELNLASQLG